MGTGTSEYDYFRSLVNAYIEQNAWRFSSDWLRTDLAEQ